jgi:hypothetical protein
MKLYIDFKGFIFEQLKKNYGKKKQFVFVTYYGTIH